MPDARLRCRSKSQPVVLHVRSRTRNQEVERLDPPAIIMPFLFYITYPFSGECEQVADIKLSKSHHRHSSAATVPSHDWLSSLGILSEARQEEAAAFVDIYPGFLHIGERVHMTDNTSCLAVGFVLVVTKRLWPLSAY